MTYSYTKHTYYVLSDINCIMYANVCIYISIISTVGINIKLCNKVCNYYLNVYTMPMYTYLCLILFK